MRQQPKSFFLCSLNEVKKIYITTIRNKYEDCETDHLLCAHIARKLGQAVENKG